MGKQIQSLTGLEFNIICGTKETYSYGPINEDKWAVATTSCCRYTFLAT